MAGCRLRRPTWRPASRTSMPLEMSPVCRWRRPVYSRRSPLTRCRSRRHGESAGSDRDRRTSGLTSNFDAVSLAGSSPVAPVLLTPSRPRHHCLVSRELPSGTVTFLFTDVEGSTKLLHELGTDAYAQALTEHRGVLRDTFNALGGIEVDIQGDAFFFSFRTAPPQPVPAAEASERLGRGRIRVRIGIHTGTPLLTEEGYVGVDVHRAARIAAFGHGGQAPVSAAP